MKVNEIERLLTRYYDGETSETDIVLLISTHRTNKWFSEKQYVNCE